MFWFPGSPKVSLDYSNTCSKIFNEEDESFRVEFGKAREFFSFSIKNRAMRRLSMSHLQRWQELPNRNDADQQEVQNEIVYSIRTSHEVLEELDRETFRLLGIS